MIVILRIASYNGWKNDEAINGVITIGKRLTLTKCNRKDPKEDTWMKRGLITLERAHQQGLEQVHDT